MISVKPSFIAILIAVFVIGSLIFSNKHWRDENKIIEADIISYYAYLPAIFIYEDPSFNYIDDVTNQKGVKIWYYQLENGGRVLKMTMGISYFYFPFFALAHQISGITDYPANGYSLPYKMAISFSSFFFFILSLIYLRKYLLLFYNEISVFWTILIVGIGTNLVTYVVREPGMSHVYSFFLVTVFLYFTNKWYIEYNRKYIIFIGLIMGLLILVRPTNILLLLIFIFYNISSFSSVRQRIYFLFKNYKELFIAIVMGFTVIVPQLLIWKYNTGSWLFYSYIDEGFFFNDPKIIEGLFSFRKGWLLYTPLMTLSLIGFLIPDFKIRKLKPVFLIFFILYLYIIFSWWCWWYGGSFGMRSMIDIYPILSLPIAMVVSKIVSFKTPLKLTVVIGFIFLISLNLFQNYQYQEGLIHHDSMTKNSYWKVWGEKKMIDGYWETMKAPDYESAKRGDR